jgi:hypothetical protein
VVPDAVDDPNAARFNRKQADFEAIYAFQDGSAS